MTYNQWHIMQCFSFLVACTIAVHLIINIIWVGNVSCSWEVGCWLDQMWR